MSDWIKVDVDTPTKNAIYEIADVCGCSLGDAFLAWFKLYAWFDSVTADGKLNAPPAEVDARAGMAGVAQALARAGWISFEGRKCIVANWFEHNGKSAKARAMAAKRSANYRWKRANPIPPPTRQ